MKLLVYKQAKLPNRVFRLRSEFKKLMFFYVSNSKKELI